MLRNGLFIDLVCFTVISLALAWVACCSPVAFL